MTKQEMVLYCLTYPGAYEDYPFDDKWTVLRHRENRKSFAFLYERGGHLCVNLKCEPMCADFLRSAFAGVLPAYHMNKMHWNTVLLDSEIPKPELQEMVRQSYELTKPKRRKKR
ncbi:MmcQ/YjbR family DNA-binding protein [Faecalispora anaeroviscerum]|uniref:MmcQ/YjbR family DNA-binding protein n=1 Tax=Faecalispora anaeroviscerum TaxID=2991836 RepID=UPI002FDCFBDF